MQKLMTPIRSSDGVRVGDVVHHAAFGFATIVSVDDRGAELRWERPGPTFPAHVSWHALQTSYRRCDGDGFFGASILEPALTRGLLVHAPTVAFGRLIAELGGPVARADVRDWLLGRWGEAGFDAWWEAAIAAVEADPRFAVLGEQLALAPGLDASAFAAVEALPDVEEEEASVLEIDYPGPAAPLHRPGPEEAWPWLLDLARKLASLHASGRPVLRRPEQLPRLGDDRLLSDPDARFDPRGDVRWLVRAAVLRIVGFQTAPAGMPDSTLLGALPLIAELPPELLGVIARSLAEDVHLRPQNGSGLWADLAAAEASAALRLLAPVDHEEEIRVGFDTHIGTVKSLAGQANQDALVLAGDPSLALLGVADGISTSNAGTGDLASSLLSRTLRAWFSAESNRLAGATSDAVRAALRTGLERGNLLVCNTAQRIGGDEFPRMIPMGTTAALAVARGNLVQIAALGDSRGWLVGRHGVAPLLPDHNLGSVRVRDALAGRPTRFDDDSAALTSYVGHFDVLGRAVLPEVYFRELILLPGEWLILATDGLSDYAAKEEAGVMAHIQRVVAGLRGGPTAKGAMELARDLVRLANDGGGGDNISVLVFTLSVEEAGADADAPVSSPSPT